MKKRSPEYKPLLFTTTMRNPERLSDFLRILKEYNGKTLDNDVIMSVVRNLISNRIYETMYMCRNCDIRKKLEEGLNLSPKEIEEIIKNSPQEHKEAGFDRGWSSRFDTWYKLAKELGFVYYEYGKKIRFSEIGLRLVDNEHPEFEQQAFLNAFVKYQRNNPFKRVLNENVPLILLLQVIKRLNRDTKYNRKGISRKEIPILLCWRDSNYEALYSKIREVRDKYRYNPSGEVILDICDEQTGGRHSSNKDQTILQEYPDEFLRKMKLTGLISIRGYGAFIDLNYNEIEKIEYAIQKYSRYEKFDSEEKYFDYMSSIDEKLISFVAKEIGIKGEMNLLLKWARHYKWEGIKEEMIILSANRSSRDAVLKLIPEPLRLEFLTSLSIVIKYPKIVVKPNYISDDEGLPSSHASGGKPDIECEEMKKFILVEVTLLTGTQQTIREMPSISRHLKERLDRKDDAISLFVSPSVHQDSLKWSEFEKYKKGGIRIYPLSISEFLSKIDEDKVLYTSEE